MNRCVICLDSFTREESISCRDGNHYVCDDDFQLYIQQNVTRTKCKAAHGRVPCPEYDCASFFDDAQTAASLVRSHTGGPLENYLHQALPVLPHVGEHDNKDAGALIEASELRCPGCHIVRDPNPDGCAALTCGHCGTYYCSVCAKQFHDDHTTHLHAESVHGSMWPHRQLVLEPGLRRQRQLQVRDHMMQIPPAKRVAIVEEARAALDALDPSLVPVALDPEDAEIEPAPNAVERNLLLESSIRALPAVIRHSTSEIVEEGLQPLLKLSLRGFMLRVGRDAKTVSRVVTTASPLQAGLSGACGSAIMDLVLMGYDVKRSVSGEAPEMDLADQLVKRAGNGAWSMGLGSAGAAAGTAVMPGVGTFVGGCIGSLIASCLHEDVL